MILSTFSGLPKYFMFPDPFIFALMYFAFDFIYMFYKKIFMGNKEDFNRLLVKIYLQYRIMTGFFAIIPYITLLIIKN